MPSKSASFRVRNLTQITPKKSLIKYYLKVVHDDGVAFLERKGGDYTGYWIGEVDDPDVNAVICPLVLSPNAKGLSAEEARSKWSILKEPCRALYSLSEISK